jgi:DNA-binding MarR family transcriptional regulator
MSGRIVGEVLDHAPEDLTTGELLVLIAIGEDARDRDRRANFSDLETLINRTRLKPGTVRNALSSLAQRGIIVPQLERVHRGGAHQEYVVSKLGPGHRGALHAVDGA